MFLSKPRTSCKHIIRRRKRGVPVCTLFFRFSAAPGILAAVKNLALAATVFLSALGLLAQETVTVTVQDAMQWASDNLDPAVLKSLSEADRQQVQMLFNELQKEFQGEYVVNLSSLKELARSVLPLLESSDDTKPYAAWLKARLDYLDAADQFRLIIRPPQPSPGQPALPPLNPAPEKQRALWNKKLADRPIPDAAKPYITKLKPIFIAEKVPAELVWLAEVESGFNPDAVSPSGAAGLFQLMPATAKLYGLRVSTFSFLDQRFKPEENARAAARNLAKLHARFKEWRLALAAYNAGEGAVRRLLEKHKAKTFDGIATHLPAETQMYVPRVEATILRREGVNLDQLVTPK
jgi:membrane-bound lytic murein transglycosylase D